jgi:hypothetical protein
MIAFCLLSAISAFAYRCGGMSQDDNANPKWMPKCLRRFWVRDWLCPLIALIALWCLKGFHLAYWWQYLIFWGLGGMALSTYWDWLFGFDNYFMHGFGCGLASIPLMWADVSLWGVLARIFACAVLMGGWSVLIKWDELEEEGRGLIFCGTMGLLIL